MLLENITKKGDQFFGRNEHMQAVFVEGTNYIPGTMTDVMVQSCNRNNLFGATNNN